METVVTLFKKSNSDRGYLSLMVNDHETLESLVSDGWVSSVDEIGSPIEDPVEPIEDPIEPIEEVEQPAEVEPKKEAKKSSKK